jgi:hypothetical protein
MEEEKVLGLCDVEHSQRFVLSNFPKCDPNLKGELGEGTRGASEKDLSPSRLECTREGVQGLANGGVVPRADPFP